MIVCYTFQCLHSVSVLILSVSGFRFGYSELPARLSFHPTLRSQNVWRAFSEQKDGLIIMILAMVSNLLRKTRVPLLSSKYESAMKRIVHV